MEINFTTASAEYIAWLSELNNSCVPAMNELNESEMEKLINSSYLSLMVFVNNIAVGAIVTFSQDSCYESENFEWFKRRYQNFLYIDRVMIKDNFRGLGIGKQLYQEIFNQARQARFASVVCEVNENPPNPKSMKFHAEIGFDKIETTMNQSQGKQVAMLILHID